MALFLVSFFSDCCGAVRPVLGGKIFLRKALRIDTMVELSIFFTFDGLSIRCSLELLFYMQMKLEEMARDSTPVNRSVAMEYSYAHTANDDVAPLSRVLPLTE